MIVKSYKNLIRTLLITTSLIGTPIIVLGMDIGNPLINSEEINSRRAQELSFQDLNGNEFLVYKVSGAGKRCGYRVFNIEPKDMVQKLMANLDQVVVYEENGEMKKKTIKEIIISDMANTVLSNRDDFTESNIQLLTNWTKNNNSKRIRSNVIEDYLNKVYVDGKIDEGELSSALIPAVAYITQTDVDFYELKAGKLALTYRIKSPSDNAPHIAFFYRLDQKEKHFDRLINIAHSKTEEIKSAKQAEAVFNYFTKNEMNLSPEAKKQLRPDNSNSTPTLSAELREEQISKIINLINQENETDRNLLMFGFNRVLIDEARARLAAKSTKSLNIPLQSTNPNEASVISIPKGKSIAVPTYEELAQAIKESVQEFKATPKDKIDYKEYKFEKVIRGFPYIIKVVPGYLAFEFKDKEFVDRILNTTRTQRIYTAYQRLAKGNLNDIVRLEDIRYSLKEYQPTPFGGKFHLDSEKMIHVSLNEEALKSKKLLCQLSNKPKYVSGYHQPFEIFSSEPGTLVISCY